VHSKIKSLKTFIQKLIVGGKFNKFG